MLPFERLHPLLACIFYLAVWFTASGMALWPFSLTRILDRLPIVLCLSGVFLAGAVDTLPKAVPHVFELAIGHSIYAMKTTKQPTGTLFSEPWIEAWQDGADAIFVWVVAAAGVWGLVNLFRRRAWISNMVAVIYTVWSVSWAFLHSSPL